MKKIEAVVPVARLDKAFAALKELDLGGFTYYDSKGQGQIPRPEIQSGRGTGTYRPEFNVNSTVVIVTKNSMVDSRVKARYSSQMSTKQLTLAQSSAAMARCKNYLVSSWITWLALSMPFLFPYSSTFFSCSGVKHTGIVLSSFISRILTPARL